MKTTYFQRHHSRFGNGWHFRIFGWGIACHINEAPRFSERMGVTHPLRIGPYAFYWLKRREVA